MRRQPHPGDDSGAAIIGLAITLVVVLAAAGLLHRTASLAGSINDKAKTIALTGRGINESTDSIIQLERTNELATSILNSAKPLEGKLKTIVGLAGNINGLAGSINGSAGTINNSARSINDTAGGINSNAKSINGTASGINSEAARILTTAQSINRGVAQINTNLDATIAVARQIRGDTTNLVKQAQRAHIKAACIDRGVAGTAGTDGHCK